MQALVITVHCSALTHLSSTVNISTRGDIASVQYQFQLLPLEDWTLAKMLRILSISAQCCAGKQQSWTDSVGNQNDDQRAGG